jgi:hypothetical protein
VVFKKPASNAVRQWLNIQVNDDFEALRESVENKGIMVIVSNGLSFLDSIGC